MTYLDISDNEFRKFKELVFKQIGINLHDGKKELVRARLSKRLRDTGIKTFKDYYAYLLDDSNGEELVQMLNAISTNLTSFFRELKHFEFIEKEFLPKYYNQINTNNKLNVWSAGCSSGEEPYSLAICFSDYFGQGTSDIVKILATDISTDVLQKAMNAVYLKDRISNISLQVVKKYFQKGHNKMQGYVRLKSEIRNLIEFRRFNLMERFNFQDMFNIIFCRNVMIYFDKNVQQALVKKYYDSLKKGGFLFIGHSESLMSIEHKFQYIKPTIYYKA